MDAYLADVTQVVPASFEDDPGAALSCLFLYGVDDPYAVVARFMTEAGEVDWTFSRDLLAEGMTGGAGEGDVRVTKGLDNVTYLELASPSGEAVIGLDSTVLRAFLDQSFAVVPQGEEWRHIEIDAWLERIAR